MLGYGYWFDRTHGTLYVSVTNAENGDQPVKDVRLSFRSADGSVLARAAAVGPYDVVSLTEPSEYSCQEIEVRALQGADTREEWQRCFSRQSRWIPTWINRAATIDVGAGSCEIRNAPVSISRYSDAWWLWWLPLPHIGGMPYASYGVYLRLHPTSCVLIGN